METSTPVTTLGGEDLKISANSLLANTLFNLPSAGIPGASQTTSNFSVFASGLSTVDLRNLGSARTLVLVNGRGHVGGASESPNVVDLNSIPAAFIDHIDVVTGGASAVYGSEAMAGVINIITKKNFNGMRFNAQVGQSSEGDGDDKSISLTGGANFADDRGNVMFHVGYSELGEINSRDRKLSRSDEFLGDFEAFSSFPPQGGIFSNDGYNTIAADGSWTKDFVSSEDGFNRAQH
ncbi:MAG: iron complex outermembrane receptor protein [Lentisphaeria bacterium]